MNEAKREAGQEWQRIIMNSAHSHFYAEKPKFWDRYRVVYMLICLFFLPLTYVAIGVICQGWWQGVFYASLTFIWYVTGILSGRYIFGRDDDG